MNHNLNEGSLELIRNEDLHYMLQKHLEWLGQRINGIYIICYSTWEH